MREVTTGQSPEDGTTTTVRGSSRTRNESSVRVTAHRSLRTLQSRATNDRKRHSEQRGIQMRLLRADTRSARAGSRIAVLMTFLLTSTFLVSVAHVTHASADASTFSISSTPNLGTPDGFSKVSCVTTAFCVGVGSYDYQSNLHPLIETWGGARWTFTTGPALAGDNQLNDVSCISVSRCTVTQPWSRTLNVASTSATAVATSAGSKTYGGVGAGAPTASRLSSSSSSSSASSSTDTFQSLSRPPAAETRNLRCEVARELGDSNAWGLCGRRRDGLDSR